LYKRYLKDFLRISGGGSVLDYMYKMLPIKFYHDRPLLPWQKS